MPLRIRKAGNQALATNPSRSMLINLREGSDRVRQPERGPREQTLPDREDGEAGLVSADVVDVLQLNGSRLLSKPGRLSRLS